MFVEPKRVVEQMSVTPGMKIADLGAGSGFYTFIAAQAAGASGRVYAIDIQKELLERVKNEARTLHLNNVEVIWGDLEKVTGTRLKEASLDLVMVSNILFQITNKDDFTKEISRILKKDGRVAIIDWSDSDGGVGPRGDHIVTQMVGQAIFEKNGFEFLHTLSAGDHHWGIVMKKK